MLFYLRWGRVILGPVLYSSWTGGQNWNRNRKFADSNKQKNNNYYIWSNAHWAAEEGSSLQIREFTWSLVWTRTEQWVVLHSACEIWKMAMSMADNRLYLFCEIFASSSSSELIIVVDHRCWQEAHQRLVFCCFHYYFLLCRRLLWWCFSLFFSIPFSAVLQIVQ